MKFYISKKQKKIIKFLAEEYFNDAVKIIPNLDRLLDFFQSKLYYQKSNIKISLKSLEKKRIICLSDEKIELSKNGIELYKKYQLEDIQIKRPKEWDSVWHLVCYDIPESKKRERDYFRFVLRNLSFKQIQKSLWVLPWECKEEIAIICQNIGIQPFVIYMNTDKIPNQEIIIKSFNL